VTHTGALTCFFEHDRGQSLARKAFAESVGTALLTVAAAGSSLSIQRLAPGSPVAALLATSVATAAALTGLILALGAVSGGHFNPLITTLQWLGKERDPVCSVSYIVAQLFGAALGAVTTNLMFGFSRVSPQVHSDLQHGSSEALASTGLLIIVFGCSRGGHKSSGPFAVGAWLTAATLATPSNSYANPAIVAAALIAAGPIALSRATALLYLATEMAGALVAFGIVSLLYPAQPSRG
jgi:glycerol uptake facilitator-like aquaporin